MRSQEEKWEAEFDAEAKKRVDECWETSLLNEWTDEVAAVEAHLAVVETLMGRLQCAVSDDRLAAQRRRIAQMKQMAKSLRQETFEILLDS